MRSRCEQICANLFVRWFLAGGLLAATVCALYEVCAATRKTKSKAFYAQNQTGALDISSDDYSRIQSWIDKIRTWGIVLATLISAATIYFTYKHKELTRGLRVFLLAENVIRWLVCLLNSCQGLCAQFAGLCPVEFTDVVELLTGYPLFLIQWLLLCQANCQFLVSINRFFAVAFGGFYFRTAQRWPIPQVLLVFAVAALNFYPRGAVLVKIGTHLTMVLAAYNCTLDCMVFIIFRRSTSHKAGGNKATERRILLQMAAYQSAFLLINLIFPLIEMAILVFFGYWMGMASDHVLWLFTNISATLGQSVVNLILIRNSNRRTESSKTLVSITSKTPRG